MASPTAVARTTLDPTSLAQDIRAELSSPSYRPPLLPVVATELLRMAHRPEVPIAEVVKVLERDPVLAARVLLIAQSARYAGRSPVVSLRQAAVRLGIASLRDVALEAAMQLKLLRVPGFGWLTQRIAVHGTVTAHVSKSVCRHANLPGEHAFLTGLLHDVGFAAVLGLLADRQVQGLTLEQLAPALTALHAEASALLVRTWEIPGPVGRLVASHHEPMPDNTLREQHAALVIAEQLAWEAGAGVSPPPAVPPEHGEIPERPPHVLDHSPPGLVESALETLGLPEASLTALREETAGVLDAMGLQPE